GIPASRRREIWLDKKERAAIKKVAFAPYGEILLRRTASSSLDSENDLGPDTAASKSLNCALDISPMGWRASLSEFGGSTEEYAAIGAAGEYVPSRLMTKHHYISLCKVHPQDLALDCGFEKELTITTWF